jgi:hypothetical protein
MLGRVLRIAATLDALEPGGNGRQERDGDEAPDHNPARLVPGATALLLLSHGRPPLV